MKNNFKAWLHAYRTYFRDGTFILSTVEAFILFGIALVVNYVAGTFATFNASNPVTDIILDHLTLRNVDGIFIYGTLAFFVFIVALLIVLPRTIPFMLKSISLFILIRSLFVVLTHIAPFPVRDVLPIDSILNRFTFGGDLFFSGHTGMPFLCALIFWKDRILRYIFLAITVIFAAVVLLGHYHYSIDVLSAFFISYAIADMARFTFRKDYARFNSEIPESNL